MSCDMHGMTMTINGTTRKIGDNDLQTDFTSVTTLAGQNPSTGMKSEIKSEIKKVSDDEVVTTTTTSLPGAGVTQTTVKQTYAGPTCGNQAASGAANK